MVRNLTSTSFPCTYPSSRERPVGPPVAASHSVYSHRSLNSTSHGQKDHWFFSVVGVNRLIGSLSRVARFIAIRQCEQVVCEYSCCFAKLVGGGRFHTLGPQYPRYQIIFRALTNEAERTLDLPRHGAARACPCLLTALVAGSVRRGRGGDRYSQRRS